MSLERKGSTDERKHGWGVAYPEWAGLVGWPVLSNPSLDEKRALPAEIEDFGVLRLPCASDPSMGGSVETGQTWELFAAAVTPCWSNASVDALTGRSKELPGGDGSDLEGELVQGKHGSGFLYLE